MIDTKMRSTALLRSLVFLSLLVLPASLSHVTIGLSSGTSLPLTYQTTGPSAPISLERISDNSFETGTAPWTELDYNNYSRGLQTVQIVHPGYNDNSAVQLTVNSGNLTIDSHVTLLQDFSKNPVAFGSGLRFRASIRTPTIQGNSITDRVEFSLTLVTSVGNTTRIHYVLAGGSSLPSNTTSDGYIASAGTSSNGWTILDRNVTIDASKVFPAIFSSLTSVKDVRLSVYSTSQSTPTHDPRIKYYETGGDTYWNTTETVVFDPDADGTYNIATDKLVYNGTSQPSNGQLLSDDPWMKYIDTNLNGQWDMGEAIVYDWHHDGVYDLSSNPTDPVICGSPPYCGPPIVGSLLQDPVRKQTVAIFDQVELYSPSGNINSIINGGFETGDLTGWGNTAGFTIATSPTHLGSYSVLGTATGAAIDLAQSIDSRPVIDSSTKLQTSAYVGVMSGGLIADKVDVWLGLVDSSPRANPLSIYYYFKTGIESVPSNTTDTLNHRVAGFGSTLQWLSLNQSLLPETSYFNSTGYTAPYRIETIVLEVSAETGFTTSAYFDDVSIPTTYKPGPVVSTYYAVDGLNSTYSYSATRIPQGQFYLNVPAGQSVLNITSPTGTIVQPSDYSTQTIGGSLLITIANATSFKYPALSNWRFYTTSKNALASVYVTPVGSTTPSSNFDPGSTVSIVSQSKDPYGNPLPGANITLFFTSNTQAIIGKADSQGTYNATKVILASNPGPTTLEAITVSSSYIGLRATQLTINNNPVPWAIIIYASIAAAALAIFSLLLLLSRRRKRAGLGPETPTSSGKNPPGRKRPAKP